VTAAPRLWRSGFCSTDDALPWQHAACDRTGGGYRRTPTKADPRDWVPCACACHRPPEETTVPETAPRTSEEDRGLNLPIAVEMATEVARILSVAARGDAIDALSWEDAVRLLDQLRDSIETLRQIDSLLVRRIYLAGPHGVNVAELDGIGRVSITRSKDRKKWDERGIARAVIDARMADTTGEAPDPWDVAEWLLQVVSVGYARVTPLRAMGLDPDAFCDVEPGKPTVQLPPRH